MLVFYVIMVVLVSLVLLKENVVRHQFVFIFPIDNLGFLLV